ncbi:hypothetical protein [Posidoniimonas polymericola]|nr:hypothetical protein [Posidoniimonas polymericola]
MVLTFVSDSGAAGPEVEIRTAVIQHFGSLPDFRPTDLIRQQDLAAVISLLEKTDVPVDRFAALKSRIPADSSEIQRLNTDAKGRQFLRKVADVPKGYAGVEDLGSRPKGARDLRKLSNSPGGEEMIAYMTTTPGGAKLMAMTPQGKATDKPAGPRIYTPSDLYKAMIELSRADARAAQ